MEVTKDYIYGVKKDLEQYHTSRVKEQKTDQEYYDDKFLVTMIKDPKYLCRTATASWLVDGPASHIITTNPQVFVAPKKDRDKETADKVGYLLNHWIQIILHQTPPPFREFIRNLLLRGEAWIHPVVNPDWDRSITTRPVFFLIPDPLNVRASPNEVNGIPHELIVTYQRAPWVVKQRYSGWSDPSGKTKMEKPAMVDWLEYWGYGKRYFEADGEPVLNEGVQDNLMGVMPWIHAYSGFGKEGADGAPEALAMGRLRKVRDLLIQECAINSDIDSIIHKFAQERIDIIVDANNPNFDAEGIKKTYDIGAGVVNIVPLPPGGTITPGIKQLPDQSLYAHYLNIRTRINEQAPPIMAGLPSGTSGRQEDIIKTAQIRRFDAIVEATEDAWGKALTMGLEIMENTPSFLPVSEWMEEKEGNQRTIKADDIDKCAPIKLVLKTKDPIEDDRKLMAAKTLYDAGLVDWERTLVDGAGDTPEKAHETKIRTIVEKVALTDPQIMGIIARKFIEKLGMKEEAEALAGQIEETARINAGAKGGEPRNMNVKTDTGREMADVMFRQNGVRSPAQQ